MAKCPKCNTEVANPTKSWKMAGRPDKTGKKRQLEMGLFVCPRCRKRFRCGIEQTKNLVW